MAVYSLTPPVRKNSGDRVLESRLPQLPPPMQQHYPYQYNQRAPPYLADMDDMLSPKSTMPPGMREERQPTTPDMVITEGNESDLGGLRPIKLADTWKPPPMDAPRAPEPEKHDPMELEKMRLLYVVDQKLKKQIRILRLAARILAFIVSVLVFVPITMTLVTFLRTKDTFRIVTRPDGSVVSRTAWANNSTTWPTYVYFGVAAVSLFMNLFIMFSYLRSNVAAANTGAYVAATFSWVVMVANIVVYGVAVSMYRVEKRSNDLWGWTCSDAARSIQSVFEKEVNFDKQCQYQTYSWYAGIVQFLTAVLTFVVFYMMWKRSQGKKIMTKIEQGNFGDVEMQMKGKKAKKAKKEKKRMFGSS